MATERQRTYSGMLGDWQRLIGTIEANLAELPQLEPFLLKLRAIFEDMLEVSHQQAALRASKQEASRRMQRFSSNGQRLCTVMRSVLKEHYGIHDERLAEFGLQPFRGRFRGDPEPEEPETPAPEAEAPTPSVE
jgi:hypothetical protein